MLKRWFLRGAALALAIIAAALFLWSALNSKSYQQCYAEYQTNTSAQQTYEFFDGRPTRGPGPEVPIFIRCFAVYFDENGGAFSALATLIIAAFTGTLWYAAAGQYDLLRDQIRLARDEFNATHRPKLLVHLVMMVDDGTLDGVTQIDFDLINGGDVTATVIEFSAYNYFQRPSAAFVPMSKQETPQSPASLILEPGEAVLVRAKSSSTVVEYGWWVAERHNTQSDQSRWFIVGFVKYRGNDATTRRMGFCREYNRVSGEWNPVQNPAYEYSY